MVLFYFRLLLGGLDGIWSSWAVLLVVVGRVEVDGAEELVVRLRF